MPGLHSEGSGLASASCTEEAVLTITEHRRLLLQMQAEINAALKAWPGRGLVIPRDTMRRWDDTLNEVLIPPLEVPGQRPCAQPGCVAPAASRGLCNAHYLRWYRHVKATGVPDIIIDEGKRGRKKKAPRNCATEGCPRMAKVGPLCHGCYQKRRRGRLREGQ